MRVYAEYVPSSQASEVMVVRLLNLESVVSSGSAKVNCFWSFPVNAPQFGITTPFESRQTRDYEVVTVDIARCRKFVVLPVEGTDCLGDGSPIFVDVSSRPKSMGDVF